MNGVVLSVERLSKSFGGVDAVRDVSFDVAAGELVALIGPNGAGKTTCFNLVNGQLAPDAGTIELSGSRIDRLPPRAIARMGVGRTFQVAATFASMTVRENVQVALLAHAGEHSSIGARATDLRRTEADALLERVRDERIAILFTYHDMDVVFVHSDRIIVLDRGRILAEGTPDAIRANADVQRVYLGEK